MANKNSNSALNVEKSHSLEKKESGESNIDPSELCENNENSKNDKSVSNEKDSSHLFVYAAAKAGMEQVDKKKLQETIYELSKGSAYFENEQRKAKQTEQRIEKIKEKLSTLSENEIDKLQKKCLKQIETIYENNKDYSRTWLIVDMDCFYAAVAMRDNPHLCDKPIAVGGLSMISTTNYEARKYGVRAAMPGFIGKKLCPQLIFVNHNWEKYKEASDKVKEIVSFYDVNFTSMSLDEMYLDITDYLSKHNSEDNMQVSGQSVAKEIREKIYESTKLTASCGVACNRMLAKICSDINKPNGQFILNNNETDVLNFIHQLSLRKIPGIGKVTERILKEIGCNNCNDIITRAGYVSLFFKPLTVEWLFKVCNGIGMNERDLNEIYQRKSISTERTFNTINNENILINKICDICDDLCNQCKKENIKGKTVTIKIKTNDFDVRTRAHSLLHFTNDYKEIVKAAIMLLKKELPLNVRLLGVRLNNLEQTEPEIKTQLQLNKFFKNRKDNENGINKNELSFEQKAMDTEKDDLNENNKNKENSIENNLNENDWELDEPPKKKRKIMTLSQMFNDYDEFDNESSDNHNYECNNWNENSNDETTNENENENGNEKAKPKAKEKEKSIERNENVNNRKEQKKYTKIKYHCPICNQDCLSNAGLNLHLDSCLKRKSNNKNANKKQKNKMQSKKDNNHGNNTLSKYFIAKRD